MGQITSLSDEALLQSALDGSQDAWVELVDRYHSKGLRYIRSQLNNPELAFDIMQNVWMTLVQAVRRQVPDQFGALFWTLLKRRVVDELRRKGRSQEDVTLNAPVRSGDSDAFSRLDMEQSPDPEPLSAAISAEEKSLIQQALEQLPDHYRLVIVARQWEGRSNRETARLLIAEGLVSDDGHVEKRVENYYYRGLKELERQLRALGFGGGGSAG